MFFPYNNFFMLQKSLFQKKITFAFQRDCRLISTAATTAVHSTSMFVAFVTSAQSLLASSPPMGWRRYQILSRALFFDLNFAVLVGIVSSWTLTKTKSSSRRERFLVAWDELLPSSPLAIRTLVSMMDGRRVGWASMVALTAWMGCLW